MAITPRSTGPTRSHARRDGHGERALILGVLLALAAGCWGFLLWQARVLGGHGMATGALTMGMGAALFLGMWVAMMVAMMFPTAAPMVLTFAAVQAGKRQRGLVVVPTWIFVGGYLLVWTALGVPAYALAAGAERLALTSAWLTTYAARLGGVVLLAAGLYQLSPLKHACLAKCRTPWQFVLTSWRDGYWGALRMGLTHGVYCVGCCWLLFAILFPLGIMNVAAMALVTTLVYAEKSWLVGPAISRATAAMLIAYGALVIVLPGALPHPM